MSISLRVSLIYSENVNKIYKIYPVLQIWITYNFVEHIILAVKAEILNKSTTTNLFLIER